ncbi:hypothetical protein L2E82_25845 [Cichorium intybus]|uniref:Uncharacterized protein n=1 Tax=Cichorium intybus TaxID=13427 RepID=A0ACB9E4P8_CICIN|nr:hypothetical protein L2E82_25845 [Cichorium intybus]
MIIKKENTAMASLQHPSPVKRSSIYGEKYRDLLNDLPSPSPRSRRLNSSLVRRNSGREMVVPRRRRASKEIVRRALMPPARKLSRRWFDFRPTPSRLSLEFYLRFLADFDFLFLAITSPMEHAFADDNPSSKDDLHSVSPNPPPISAVGGERRQGDSSFT